MSEQSRSKRPPDFHLYRQCADHRRCQLVGERQIIELISLGAPLPGILNKLCMMIDVRIGNVVSIVSLPEADENHNCSMTRSALQVGLEVFSSSAILAPDTTFLGTLEIYRMRSAASHAPGISPDQSRRVSGVPRPATLQTR